MEFGCKLSPRDVRDFKIKAMPAGAAPLPEEYICDLNINVKNQKSVSSCVAHAISSILEYHAKGKYELSTNFIYGAQNAVCGRSEGKGMFLRDACKIVTGYGDMLLDDCPGNTETPKCYEIAEQARVLKERLEMYDAIAGHDEFSKTVAMKMYLNMNDAEVENNWAEMEKDMMRQKIIEAKAEKLAEREVAKWEEELNQKDAAEQASGENDEEYTSTDDAVEDAVDTEKQQTNQQPAQIQQPKQTQQPSTQTPQPQQSQQPQSDTTQTPQQQPTQDDSDVIKQPDFI